MPVRRCTSDGKPGWSCGNLKCYVYTEGDAASEKRAKKAAIKQCIAIGEDPGGGASVTSAANPVPAAAHLTGVVKKGMDRAAKLEPQMASALVPTLDRAADEAARRFVKLTESSAAPDGTGWAMPSSDELVDVDKLVVSLKKKLDPIMFQVLKAVQEAIFANPENITAAGEVSFNVTNPYTKALIDRTAGQITSVAETTRTQVRRVMADAYDEGLSIPHTADRIREKMKEANQGRATLIARTEFVGMVNGGSLAAAQTYEDSAQSGMLKKWLTAPGAKHPRHETYFGLNGQLRKLKDAFDVNGSALQHPGDPNGPAREVCRCRCAIGYEEPSAAHDPLPDISYEGDWSANPFRRRDVEDTVDGLLARYDLPLQRVQVRAAEEFSQLAGSSNDTIYLSPRYLDDDFMAARMKEWATVSVDKDANDVIIHEAGHIADKIMARDHPALYERLNAFFEEEVPFGDTGKMLPRLRVSTEAPSAYATENRYEFFAEAFTDYYRNGSAAHPSSVRIGELVEEAFGRQAAVVDNVSVGAGEPVPASIVERIHEYGLDRPLGEFTPTTDVGKEIYRNASSTEEIYAPSGIWSQDRQALHDEIVTSHFEGKTPSEERRAFFTAGGGASGKSHALFDVDGELVGLEELGAREDVIWIDPDVIKRSLPEYRRLSEVNDIYAAMGVHEESSMLAKVITERAYERGFSVIIDTTGSSSAFVSKMRAAAELGYDVKTTMFSIPTNEAIVRSIARAERVGSVNEGRYVAIEPLKHAHAGASANLTQWQNASFINDWRVYDNSGTTPMLVAEGHAGKVTILNRPAWQAILAKALEGVG